MHIATREMAQSIHEAPPAHPTHTTHPSNKNKTAESQTLRL